MPVGPNTVPEYIRPENASVFDTPVHRAIRWLAHWMGADDPTTQVFGLASPMMAAETPVNKVVKGIKAYHGSPHDFEQFDLSKVGSGEGAQAYGHGLYFAEKEATAKAYRAALSNNQPSTRLLINGTRLIDLIPDNRIASDIGVELERNGLNPEAALQRLPYGREYLKPHLERLRGASIEAKPPGHMYEVGIHADPEQFLDWDRPLGQQSQQVREALAKEWLAHPEAHANQTGAQIYRSAGQEASSVLRKAGIPGIKYLDQGSRAVGEGTSNYVVFDDKLIEILRKYGFLPPAAAAAYQYSQGREQ